MPRIALVVFAAALLGAGSAYGQNKQAGGTHEGVKGIGGGTGELPPVVGSALPCRDGKAGSFACSNVDLLSFLPIDAVGGSRGTDGKLVTTLNDIWGWTDPLSGREYALVGRSDGMAVVDVTEAEQPVYMGSLPSHDGVVSIWRDIKVIDHYALVVADGRGQHGLQVFDLHDIRDVVSPPVDLAEAAHADFFGQAHNVVVDEESRFAYAVGSDGACPGLLMIDMNEPTEPRYAGCYADPGAGLGRNGYTHDAQCVVYRGPDPDYKGREICIGSNETVVQITDVTDKESPHTISIASYPDASYAHQGWLTSDHRYFYLDDELDEVRGLTPNGTRTLIWDLEDLDDPQLAATYFGRAPAIDHNQYIVGDRAFQSNYTSGLRVLDVSDPLAPVEVGYFDTYPANDSAIFQGAWQFNGTWSNYPFFESGNVVVSGINEGLFVVRPTEALDVGNGHDDLPQTFRLLPAYPNPFNSRTVVTLQIDRPQHVRVAVVDARGRAVRELFSGDLSNSEPHEVVFDASGLASGVYVIRAIGATTSASTTVTLQK